MTLRYLRKERGITQAGLAAAIGTSQQCIHFYESGERKPSPEVAERIRKFFGISVEEMWNILYKNQSETA